MMHVLCKLSSLLFSMYGRFDGNGSEEQRGTDFKYILIVTLLDHS